MPRVRGRSRPGRTRRVRFGPSVPYGSRPVGKLVQQHGERRSNRRRARSPACRAGKLYAAVVRSCRRIDGRARGQVDEPSAPIGREQHVPGLDVAVRDAVLRAGRATPRPRRATPATSAAAARRASSRDRRSADTRARAPGPSSHSTISSGVTRHGLATLAEARTRGAAGRARRACRSSGLVNV